MLLYAARQYDETAARKELIFEVKPQSRNIRRWGIKRQRADILHALSLFFHDKGS